MSYKFFSATLFLFAIGFLIYVRLAPSDPTRWHVDPETVELDQKPHHFRVLPNEGGDMASPVYALAANELALKIDAIADSKNLLAGSLDALHVTYVLRTKTLAYPDYVSVKIIPLTDQTSTVALYSRSRFGYADGGMNKRRLEGWIEALRPFEV